MLYLDVLLPPDFSTYFSLATYFFPGDQRLKHLPPMWETPVGSLGQEDPLEKEIATCSSIRAWRIPWTEELGRLH